MASIFKSLFSNFIFWLIAFISPIQEILITVFALIVFDFITGVMSAVKSKGWKSIRSSRMGDTVIKLLLYEIGLIIGYACELYLIPAVPLVKIVSGFIALTELKSLSENIGVITGKGNFFPYVKAYIKSKFKSESQAIGDIMESDINKKDQ